MRIISGSARGRILKSPKGMLTRPTLDRTRESLFNMLESRGSLAGARVLDIFAGTGALGLEALSAVQIRLYSSTIIRRPSFARMRRSAGLVNALKYCVSRRQKLWHGCKGGSLITSLPTRRITKIW